MLASQVKVSPVVLRKERETSQGVSGRLLLGWVRLIISCCRFVVAAHRTLYASGRTKNAGLSGSTAERTDIESVMSRRLEMFIVRSSPMWAQVRWMEHFLASLENSMVYMMLGLCSAGRIGSSQERGLEIAEVREEQYRHGWGATDAPWRTPYFAVAGRETMPCERSFAEPDASTTTLKSA